MFFYANITLFNVIYFFFLRIFVFLKNKERKKGKRQGKFFYGDGFKFYKKYILPSFKYRFLKDFIETTVSEKEEN